MKTLTKHQLAKQTPRTLAEKVINRENRITYLNNRINELEKELAEAGGMIGVLREYVSDLEKGLESSIAMNKAQAERQVKELTDEEIIAVGNAVVNHIDSNEGWIEFARAILRKAQEK